MLAPLKGLFRTGLTAGLTRRGDEMRPAAPTEPKDIVRERLEKSLPRAIIF
jgi:hypothetical protein